MAVKKSVDKDEFDGLTKIASAIPFLLAGLEGHTDGVEIHSISLQRGRDSGMRVVLRGESISPDGHTLRVVAFTNAELATEVLLLAETGYRENVIRWHLDRFAIGTSDNGRSENGVKPLRIVK